VDAVGALTTKRVWRVRRSRVVPTPRCWCQARKQLRATVSITPGTPRRARN